MQRSLCFVIAAVALSGCSGGADSGSGSAPSTPPSPPVATANHAAPATGTSSASAAATQSGLGWDNLDLAVGKYARDIDFFGAGAIGATMRELVGDRFAILERNLAVAGPLMKSDGVYYITGNAVHEGGSDQAYVLIDPRTHAMEIGMWQDGKRQVFMTPDAHIAKPADVATMIANSAPEPPLNAH